MIEIRRAGERLRTDRPGISTWHSFSSGPHYDPANLSFGPVIGVDEHLVDPGAGFDWHGHRGVDIFSWVLEGTLRHEDAAGVRDVGPGELLRQSAGTGIRHRETNASGVAPLRFVQTTLLGDADAAVGVRPGPATLGAASPAHVVVVRGGYWLGGDALGTGDSVRVSGGDVAVLDGDGELLVVEFSAPA